MPPSPIPKLQSPSATRMVTLLSPVISDESASSLAPMLDMEPPMRSTPPSKTPTPIVDEEDSETQPPTPHYISAPADRSTKEKAIDDIQPDSELSETQAPTTPHPPPDARVVDIESPARAEKVDHLQPASTDDPEPFDWQREFEKKSSESENLTMPKSAPPRVKENGVQSLLSGIRKHPNFIEYLSSLPAAQSCSAVDSSGVSSIMGSGTSSTTPSTNSSTMGRSSSGGSMAAPASGSLKKTEKFDRNQDITVVVDDDDEPVIEVEKSDDSLKIPQNLRGEKIKKSADIASSFYYRNSDKRRFGHRRGAYGIDGDGTFRRIFYEDG